jgi:hypothetical protein
VVGCLILQRGVPSCRAHLPRTNVCAQDASRIHVLDVLCGACLCELRVLRFLMLFMFGSLQMVSYFVGS